MDQLEFIVRCDLNIGSDEGGSQDQRDDEIEKKLGKVLSEAKSMAFVLLRNEVMRNEAAHIRGDKRL
ncbi:MAG: hypothetical protein ACTFAK_16355 [Candidatus Electronema sp. VV]